ncbi:MAG: nucleotidyltransferase domain-containing protein [Magnetococcales bacterium]|nr:nucleotidyltransferase domain-containing protein [Magnetococcales bacterium]
MPLDIQSDHLNLIREILQRHIPDREVWAFGSRVRGTANDASDLDLCIRGDGPLAFDQLGRLRDAFSLSDLPFRVDVLDWWAISESFKNLIEDKHEVLQKHAHQVMASCSQDP